MVKHKRKAPTKTQFTSDYRPISKCPEVRRNDEPKPSDLDQKLPRRVRDIKRLQELASKPIIKKKSKQKNVLLALAEKHGFKKKPWETDAKLKRRMLQETSFDIQHDLLKAKFGVAGRDVAEIKKDYKELDDKEQKRKDAKAARRKKLQGTMSVESKVEASADKSGNNDEQDEESEEVITKKKRLTKNDRIRQQKKNEKEIQEKELMFDAKEIIPFGERVDAPPEFKGILKNLGDSSKKAGSKNLLLKQVLENNQSTKKIQPEVKNVRVGEQERQKVIEMYRQMKKQKQSR